MRRERTAVTAGTRGSALAMAQTRFVVDRLRAAHLRLWIDVARIRTSGDADQTTPLATLGGQGVFVKEIENALLSGEIDIAVHSLKDMPSAQPRGLTIAAVLPREDPRDVLISRDGVLFRDLPSGARVGTGSLRRQAQLRSLRPELTIVELRGNVDTRLRKLRSGEYDAIVLAAAGLMRLGRASEITEYLPPEVMLPAVGQGAICVEARADDTLTLEVLKELDDELTRAATSAERGVLRELGAGCQVPIAAYAECQGDALWLRMLVADPASGRVVRVEGRGLMREAEEIGRRLARTALGSGAGELLEGR